MISNQQHKKYRQKVWNMDQPRNPEDIPKFETTEDPDKYNFIKLDSDGNLISNEEIKR